MNVFVSSHATSQSVTQLVVKNEAAEVRTWCHNSYNATQGCCFFLCLNLIQSQRQDNKGVVAGQIPLMTSKLNLKSKISVPLRNSVFFWKMFWLLCSVFSTVLNTIHWLSPLDVTCSPAFTGSGYLSLSGRTCCLNPTGKVKCSEAALQCQNDNQHGSQHKYTPSECVSAFSAK